MTKPTDMPTNFKTPSLLLIYGRTPGKESLVLKKPRLFKSANPGYTVTPLPACQLAIKWSLMSQSTSISVFCWGKTWNGLSTSMKSNPKQHGNLACFVSWCTCTCNLDDSLPDNKAIPLLCTAYLGVCPFTMAGHHFGRRCPGDGTNPWQQAAVARRILWAPWHTPKSACLMRRLNDVTNWSLTAHCVLFAGWLLLCMLTVITVVTQGFPWSQLDQTTRAFYDRNTPHSSQAAKRTKKLSEWEQERARSSESAVSKK